MMPGSPLDFSAVPRVPARRAPQLGEDTEEILADVLASAPEKSRASFDAGVVAGVE
jgi:2-methylfumaryl-CoA isomerase